MRTAKFVAALMVVSVALTASYSAQQAKDTRADVALQAAIKIETIDGNLKGAIDAYAKVVATYASNRPIAAQALARMAQCYEKLGATQADEARKTYERLVREFGDQKDLVAQAQARLAALGAGGQGPSTRQLDRVAWTFPTNQEFAQAVSWDGRFVAYQKGEDLFLHDLVTGIDRQVTRGDKDNFPEGGVAFSRDGNRIAYTWFNTDHDELRVLDLRATGIPQSRLLLGSTDIAYPEPHDWTPDGKWIAVDLGVDRKRTVQIGLVSADNGSLRVLKSIDGGYADIGNVCLSPDGKYLAYGRGRIQAQRADIFVLPTDGGPEVPAVVDPADDQLMGWSADGGRLVFTSDRTGSNSLWTLPVRDGQPHGTPEIAKRDIGPKFWALGLSASGSLYYDVTGSDGGNTRNIKIASFDFDTGRMLSAPSDLVREYFVGRNGSPAWSPDGKAVAYTSSAFSPSGRFNEASLVIRSLDTGQILHEIRPRLASLGGIRWAPDGRSFVVSGALEDRRIGLFRIDLSTGQVTPILFNDNDPAGLQSSFYRWSQDGKSVLLARASYGYYNELTLVERDLASGSEREIYRGSARPTLDPVLSRDGTKVYYRRLIPEGSKERGDGGAVPFQELAFIERDLSSGAEREVIRGTFGGVNLSPDGRYIVTGHNDAATKARSIQVIPVAGGQPRELIRVDLPPAVIESQPFFDPLAVYLWARDSRSLLVTKTLPGKSSEATVELWWVSVDGREAPKLVSGISMSPCSYCAGVIDIRVHPDGRRIALTIQDGTSKQPNEVWVLENFLPKAPSTVKK